MVVSRGKLSVAAVMLVFIILFSGTGAASEIELYRTTFTVTDKDTVSLRSDIVLKDFNTTFILKLPDDAEGIQLSLNGQPMQEAIMPSGDIKIVKLEAKSEDEITLLYTSMMFLEKGKSNLFIAEVKTPYAADMLETEVILPERAVLAKKESSQSSSITASSVLPKPESIDTDGRSIIITWKKSDVAAQDSISMMVFYDRQKSSFFLILALSIATVLGFFIIVFLIKRPKEVREVIKEVRNIDEHLKEDEEQVMKILKTKGGSCEQGTLVLITGMSKAYVSRVLQELEERKVIVKEKRGKKNIIHIKEGLWNRGEQ